MPKQEEALSNDSFQDLASVIDIILESLVKPGVTHGFGTKFFSK